MLHLKTSISAFILAAALGFAGTACAKPYGQVQGHNHSHKTQIKPGYSAPPSYLKPGASVSYMHNLKSGLSAGETVTFQLILDEAYSAGQLDVNIAPEGAISLYVPADQLRIDMGDGDSHVIDVTVTANANGRHYINVHAVTDKGSPRIFGIGVQVGSPVAKKPNSQMVTMPSGENLILMDAVETVK